MGTDENKCWLRGYFGSFVPAPNRRGGMKKDPRPASKWPIFYSLEEMKKDFWGYYYEIVYGDYPTEFPVNTQDLWMLYDSLIIKLQVAAPATVGVCPLLWPVLGQRYG